MGQIPWPKPSAHQLQAVARRNCYHRILPKEVVASDVPKQNAASLGSETGTAEDVALDVPQEDATVFVSETETAEDGASHDPAEDAATLGSETENSEVVDLAVPKERDAAALVSETETGSSDIESAKKTPSKTDDELLPCANCNEMVEKKIVSWWGSCQKIGYCGGACALKHWKRVGHKQEYTRDLINQEHGLLPCANCNKMAEKKIVSWCGSCDKIAYCGGACALKHWKRGGHKQECTRDLINQEQTDERAARLAAACKDCGGKKHLSKVVNTEMYWCQKCQTSGKPWTKSALE